jgi:hypothetical protein
VTFVSSTGLYQRRADGTGRDSLLWAGGFDEGVVSPDGQWIVYRKGASSAAAGGRDIYGIHRGDTMPVPLVVTPFDEMAIALSPDGKWLAYHSDETGRIEVFVRPFPNTNSMKVQVSNGGGMAPLWSRDGRELFYLGVDQKMMAVQVTTMPALQVSEPRVLFQLSGALAQLRADDYAPWDVAPDGRFIMARTIEQDTERVAPLIVIENWLEELKTKMKR